MLSGDVPTRLMFETVDLDKNAVSCDSRCKIEVEESDESSHEA